MYSLNYFIIVLTLLFTLCISIAFPVLLLQNTNDDANNAQIRNLIISIIALNSIVTGVFFITSILLIDFIFSYKNVDNIITRTRHFMIFVYVILLICSAIITFCIPSLLSGTNAINKIDYEQFLYYGTLISIFASFILIIIYSFSCNRCNRNEKGAISEVYTGTMNELLMVKDLIVENPEKLMNINSYIDNKEEEVQHFDANKKKETPRYAIRSPRKGLSMNN